jgi:hypothetical protein
MRKYSTSDPNNKIIHECALRTSELFLLFYICITTGRGVVLAIFYAFILYFKEAVEKPLFHPITILHEP